MKYLKLIWSHRAAEDLRRLQAYIAFNHPRAALNQVILIRDATVRLRRFPHSGRVVPELMRPEIREILVGNYRIVYKVFRNVIVILTVFEAHKLLE